MSNHTQKENFGTRDLGMSQWIRTNLPSSYKGFRVTDIDFYLRNPVTRRHMLIEVKLNNSGCKPWQHEIMKDMAKWIRLGSASDDWHFMGSFIISLSHPDPINCDLIRIFDTESRMPARDVTADELSEFLSMEKL